MRRLIVILPVALFAGLIGVMVALLTDSERNSDLSRLPSPLDRETGSRLRPAGCCSETPSRAGFRLSDLIGPGERRQCLRVGGACRVWPNTR